MTALDEDTRLDGLAAARSLREITAREAPLGEELRTLTGPMVDALWESGLMTWLNVPAAGGSEPAFSEIMETWIELAWQDGSLGWIGIANFPSAMAASAYLPDAGFAEMFGDPSRRVTTGGQFFPNGTGVRTDGGYVLTGSWNFGSGSGHSEYVSAGFIPIVEGEAKFDISEIRAALDSAPRGHVPRQLARPRLASDRQLRLLGVGGVRPRASLLPAVPARACSWREPVVQNGTDADHRSRPRMLGARCRQEHARRRGRIGPDEVAHVRYGAARAASDLPTELRPLHGHVAGCPGRRVRGIHCGRARGDRRRPAHPARAGGHAGRRHLCH